MVNELSIFFVSTAKPSAGVAVPIDVKLPCEVFGQMLGFTVQAGIESGVVSVT